jgi:hypothetical protein
MGGEISVAGAVVMHLARPVALAQVVALAGVVVVVVALMLGVAVMLVVAMGMAKSMLMAASCGIGPGLRQEGGLAAFQVEPPLLQKIGQHGILKQPQLTGAHLQRDMAVAEVIGRPQQVEGVGGAHHQ